MPQVYVKVLPEKEALFLQQTGKEVKTAIQKVDKKVAEVLVKLGIVELADIQREMEGQKKEVIETDFSTENINLLKNPELLDLLVKEINLIAVGEQKSIKTLFLVCALAKVKNKKSASANLCLNAQSGTGKDFVVAATLDLFPDKLIFRRRRISERALDYALAQHQSRDWSNFIIYLEDVSEGVLNSDSVKTLLTASTEKENITTIVHEGTIKDLKIKGKPVFIFTTAKSKPKEETLRRIPFCFMDETPEQTLNITKRQAVEAKTGIVAEINTNFKKFFLGLNLVSVVIPFAEDVQEKLAQAWISKNKRFQVILRTIFPRFLDYIKASAALHQHQRVIENDSILAQQEDYENARLALLSTTSNKMLIPLNREQKELVEVLEKHFPEGGSVEKIFEKFTKWEERWLRIQLDKLTDLGFLQKEMLSIDSTISKKPIGFYKAEQGVLDFSMPSWEELFVRNNAIDNCSVNAIDAINQNNSQNTAINANDSLLIENNQWKQGIPSKISEQMHQLSRDFRNEIAQNLSTCEICGVEGVEKFENQFLCKACISKFSGMVSHK